jgi:hypothetical protein
MSKASSRRGFLGASAAAVSSLANPGLGVELDRAVLDRTTTKIDR